MPDTVKPSRQFSANIGDYSVDDAGPDAIENDIDSIMRMFDPGTEHALGIPGGISAGNIQEGTVTDVIIGERTIDQNTTDSYVNTGTIGKLLSFLAKTIKALKGTANWHTATTDTIEGIHGRVVANTTDISTVTDGLGTHKTSGDHDSRYYKKSEIDNTVATLATKNENALKADSTDVYTKTQLEPYLRGGNTVIKREVYTIVNSNNGDGTFTYKDSDNNEYTGELGESGEQIFALQKGKYALGEERIEAIIDDTIHKSVASGGLEEIDETHIALTEPVDNDAEITIKYYESIGIVGLGLVQISEAKPKINAVWFKLIGNNMQIKPPDNDYANVLHPETNDMQVIMDGGDTLKTVYGEHVLTNSTTAKKGHVQLEDSIESTSTTKAATPNSVKSAYDLANTANDIANAVKVPVIVSVTANKTLSLTDSAKVLNCANSSDITITIPINSSVAFPIGSELGIIRSGTGNVTFAGSVTINSDGNKKKIKAQHTTAALKKIDTDTWILIGNLS